MQSALAASQGGINPGGAVIGTVTGAALGGLLGFALDEWLGREDLAKYGAVGVGATVGVLSAVDRKDAMIPVWFTPMFLLIPAGAIAGLTAGFSE